MLHSFVSRAVLATFVLAALLTTSSFLNIRSVLETRGLLNHLKDVVALRLLKSGDFSTHVAQTIREIQTYALADDGDELVEAVAALALARADLDLLTRIEPADHLADAIEARYLALNVRRRALLRDLDALIGVVQRIAGPAELRAILDQVERIEGEAAELARESQQALAQERALIDQLAAQSARQSYIVIVSDLISPLAFAALALVFVVRGVARPIRQLADAVVAFSRGRPQPPIAVTSTDEIGMLQRAFNTLVATIERQTADLTQQALVAEHTRAQAQTARRLADDLVERNAQIAAQAQALQAEISERRLVELALIQARDAAQVANQAKGTFLATVSHELRTPLTAVLGYSQLAAHMVDRQDYSRLPTALDAIEAAGKHLLVLINDVLDFSQIEAGSIAISCAPIDIGSLVRAAAERSLTLVQRNGNTLAVICPPDIGVMASDELKVRQILLNLLSNAAKFTELGTVSLSVEALTHNSRPYVRFSVVDTGIGISAEQIPLLFQPFTQIDGSPTRRYGGTGLGLALSQRLAQMLGGTIVVESTYGVGSRFMLELPRTYTRVAGAAPRAPAPVV